MNVLGNVIFKLLYLTGSDDTFYATKLVGSYDNLKDFNIGLNHHRFTCPESWELLVEIEYK